ncbi:MAG: toprim domain-containing protein [Actinomycetota bacterium]|nr:toprim domain-containing protein [Actinomycetota bacterium]
MAATRSSERASPVTFFEQAVAPVVFERLDELFPEFGFVRDHHGWRATNDETTRAFFGARAERVVCHQRGGFYIHGQGAVPWLSHLASGAMPRGRDYVDAVRRLAHAAGIDTTPLDQSNHTQRRDSGVPAVRVAWFQHAVELLRDPARGAGVRAYLGSRGITNLDVIEGLVGVAPPHAEAWRRLTEEGHERAAISASGVLADSRLPGRLVGAWRDESGSIATIWARSTHADAPARERYLYTRGARRPALPYLAQETRATEVVIVEGVLDALALRAHGRTAAVALGGSSAAEATWRALSRRGVRHAWLFADHDPAGDQACRAATRSLLRSTSPLRLSIRLEDASAEHKDMAALLAARPDLRIDTAWLDERCVDCVEHETRSILARHGSAPSQRQAAFDDATRFLASVPAAYALGREAAICTLAIWARVDPTTIHAVTHTREDATSLRARVRDLEQAITTARSLIGDARLPVPSDAPDQAGYALDAHERITSAYQQLSAALPVFPSTRPTPPGRAERLPLPDRSIR